MKRLFSIVLTLALLFSISAPALAAKATATTLRLEKAEGTVETRNASGKSVPSKAGTRLYSGYQVATKKSSYAYISLDNAKAIKLDASSSTEVRQAGKNLEVKVLTGKMFFDVTEPLKADEQLTIRTSTMVTGVRGTSGWVEVLDRYTTRVSLLEGILTITSTDPLTGAQRITTIVGGQTATIVYHGEDQNYASEIIIEDETIQDLIDEDVIHDEHIIHTKTGLTVENLQEEDVPGFVAVEVKKDKNLQTRIEDTTDLSVPEIIGDAGERLEEEEAAAEAEDKIIQEELENLIAEDVDPLFEESSTASGAGGAPVPTYNLTVTKEFYDANRIQQVADREVTSQNLPQNGEYSISLVPPTGYAFDSITGDDNATTTNDAFVGIMDTNKNILIQYYSLTEIHLSSPTVTQVNNAYSGGYQTVYVNGTVSIDPNNPNDITINLGNGNALHFNGNASSLSNGVNLATVAGSTVTVDEGTFTNNGSIAGQGTMTVSKVAVLENNATIQIGGTDSLHVLGDLINNYTIDVGTTSYPGLLALEGTGRLTNNGVLGIGATGSLTTEASTTFTNGTNGIILNHGAITNNGTFGGFFNAGTNSSFDPSAGTFINNGTIDPTDELYSMVMDSSNKIIAWRTAASLFMDNWIANATHTLVGSQNLYDNGQDDGWYNNWDSSALNAQDVTLDLNGRTLTLPQIFLIEGGSLTITDSTNTSGKITAAETSDFTGSNSSLISVQYGGSLTLNSGTLENNSVSTDGIATGTAVQVGDPIEDDESIVNTFTMSGGTLTGSSTGLALYGGSTAEITGGTIFGDGYGIYMDTASLSMSGGSVSGSMYGICDDTNGDTATITISGGSVSAEGEPGYSAYGIHTWNGGTFLEYEYDENWEIIEGSERVIPGTTVTISGNAVISATTTDDDPSDDYEPEAYGIYNMYFEDNPMILYVNDMTTPLCSPGDIEGADGAVITPPDGTASVSGSTGAIYFYHSGGI